MSIIFNNSSDSLNYEIDKILENFLYSNPKEFEDNVDSLVDFYNLYFLVFNEIYNDAYDFLNNNIKTVLKRDKLTNEDFKRLFKNLIENMNFNIDYSKRIINKFNNNDFNIIDHFDQEISEKNMLDIMCSFLEDEFNNSDEFLKLINNGKLYSSDLSEEDNGDIYCGGYTIYNHVTGNSIVVISNNEDMIGIRLMSTIMHEFGHVIDNIERKTNRSKKENLNYVFSSSYTEVYSHLYESLFYKYLIKNNIFKDNGINYLKILYESILSDFYDIYDISTLCKTCVQHSKKIGYDFKNNELFNNLDSNEIIKDDISYGYGRLIGNYLSDIKLENEDKFKDIFINFSNNIFSLFNEDIFNKMGTNSEEVIGYLNKDLKKIQKSNKLILK